MIERFRAASFQMAKFNQNYDATREHHFLRYIDMTDDAEDELGIDVANAADDWGYSDANGEPSNDFEEVIRGNT